MSLPPFPKYVGNPFDSPVNPRTPEGMIKAQAIQRGTYLLSKIPLWLRKDPSYRSGIPGFNPPDDWTMPEETIALIISYFDSETGKEWLGRQFWLIQGGNAPWPGNLDETSPINMDDIPMFFNWLFRIPNTVQIPHNEPSPLSFQNNELHVQEGGRKKRYPATRNHKRKHKKMRKNTRKSK